MSKINRSIILVNQAKTDKTAEKKGDNLLLLSDLVLLGIVRTAARGSYSVPLRGVCIKWGLRYRPSAFRFIVGLVAVGGLRVGDVVVREGRESRRLILSFYRLGFITRIGRGVGLSAYYIPTARGRLFVSECLQALRVEAERDILNVMGWKGSEEQEKAPNNLKIEGGKRKRGFVGDWD